MNRRDHHEIGSDAKNRELLGALRALGSVINSKVETKLDSAEHAFEMAAAAVLMKAHEFCLEAVQTPAPDSFFLLASLRGICEDYISLRFIHEQAKSSTDRDRVVFLRMMAEVHESSAAQWKFFKDHHSTQRLYYKDNISLELKQVRDEIRILLSGHPINANASMPSAYHMAATVELLSLYRYVYHATSQFVHFSPRLLLRMGWGGPPTFSFSVRNFCDYYSHFAIFYGVFLFSGTLDWMIGANVGAIQNSAGAPSNVLKTYIRETSRWPELVTFEEMNVGALSRILSFKSPDEVI